MGISRVKSLLCQGTKVGSAYGMSDIAAVSLGGRREIDITILFLNIATCLIKRYVIINMLLFNNYMLKQKNKINTFYVL